MRNSVHKINKTKRFSYTHNKVQLVRGGRDYFQLLEKMIGEARQSIHMQTYIFEDDETGRRVGDALIAAAKRNVQTYLLVDGFASQDLSEEFINDLATAGIHFRHFEPLFKSHNFYFGRRLHSKVLVTDAINALVGGVNITNRYNDMPNQPAWLDFALFVQGPAAVDAYEVCMSVWSGRKKRKVIAKPDISNVKFEDGASSLVRLRRNDWVNNRLQISSSYLEMFRTSASHITILSSYALPGNIFRKNLEKAIKRGVKVRMIISGMTDVLLVKMAEKYWYSWLLRNKIEIYEYTKNVLHGKLATSDGEWMTIGSYNVNDLSAYVSIELNFDVRDPVFVMEVENKLQQIIDNDCISITNDSNKRVHLLNRFGRWIAYNLIRITLSIFTFYYRKQK
jgi:cardiolipin synthase A/B